MSTTVTAPTIDALNRRSAGSDISIGLLIGAVLTLTSYLVGVAAGWIQAVNPIEALAVFAAYVGTYLCVVQRRINYPINAISTAAYCVLFFQQGLLSSTLLNLYLTPALLYGWFRWRADNDYRPVSTVRFRWVPVYIGVTLIAYAGATLITTALGGKLAAIDALILAGTILAQFLLDNKKLENWLVWFVVDVIAIYEYFSSGLTLVGFQYVFFLLNTVWGFVAWWRSMKRS